MASIQAWSKAHMTGVSALAPALAAAHLVTRPRRQLAGTR
jgi:hypothetical protein